MILIAKPWRLCVVLLVACGIRIAAVGFSMSSLEQDNDAYARLAINWATSQTYGHEDVAGYIHPTAYRPPLYPWILSWLVYDGRLNITAVAALHAAMGCLTVWLTWSVGRRLRVAYPTAASMAVALDPVLLRQSQLVMTETLATTLSLIVWWLWLVVYPFQSNDTCVSKSRNLIQWLALIGLGLTFGLSILARPTAAPWLAMCLVAMLGIGCACWKRRINDCLLIAILVSATLSPWVLRNLEAFGKPIWATTHGGYTLLLANNPSLYQHFSANGPDRNWDSRNFDAAWASRFANGWPLAPASDYWNHIPDIQSPPDHPMDEVLDDQFAFQAGLKTIREAPLTFAKGCIYRVLWLWAIWPNGLGNNQTNEMGSRTDGATEQTAAASPLGPSARTRGLMAAMGMAYSLEFGLAILGAYGLIIKKRYRAWCVGLAMMVSLTAVHAVFWSNMRMRSPAVPCVALLAMAGLGGLSSRRVD